MSKYSIQPYNLLRLILLDINLIFNLNSYIDAELI